MLASVLPTLPAASADTPPHTMFPLPLDKQLARQFNRSAQTELIYAPERFAKVCPDVVRGSHFHDYDTFEYNGPTDDREIVFNLGAYKTGSTSFDAAAQKLGMRACKTGWGEVGPGGGISFSLDASYDFTQCPVPGDGKANGCDGRSTGIFHKAINQCAVVGDAPWPYLFPTLMRAFPKAKFVYTRQKSCRDWIYHVTGLVNAGYCGGPLLPCFYNETIGSRPDVWYDRCVEVERTIVLTAQMLKRPLLVLHAAGDNFNLNMEVVAKFLGKAYPQPNWQNTDYPHSPTPSVHCAECKPPPADVFDPNFDLWSDRWNGGVPEGDFTRMPRPEPSLM